MLLRIIIPVLFQFFNIFQTVIVVVDKLGKQSVARFVERRSTFFFFYHVLIVQLSCNSFNVTPSISAISGRVFAARDLTFASVFDYLKQQRQHK